VTRSAGRPGHRSIIDLARLLVASANPSISCFARRDLLGEKVGPVSLLWDLKEARRIVGHQNSDGSWTYRGGKERIRSRENYDQVETFRQVAILVEMFGFTREHTALARAAEFLCSFQTPEGDFRGIYGSQYAPTYTGAIMELLIKAGYANDARIAKGFEWLIATRQHDGGWAIPLRTRRVAYSQTLDLARYPDPLVPDLARPSSHLVTGMVLRAFAAHPSRRRCSEARHAGAWLASRLYQRDAYPDRGDASYWERVSFPFWFTDIVSALDTLSRLGLAPNAQIHRAVLRLGRLRRRDGSFALKIVRGRLPDLPWWIVLAVCRSLQRWGLSV
jgi:hypothetical protein